VANGADVLGHEHNYVGAGNALVSGADVPANVTS
jgi:hypothetical protein